VTLAAGDILTPELAVTLILATFGTALGSVLRDRIVHVLRTRAGRADLGVLAANLTACAVVGLTAGLAGTAEHTAAANTTHALVAVGFAGGLSTWSSLAVEVAGALRARRWRMVLLHIPAAFALALGVFLASRLLTGGAS